MKAKRKTTRKSKNRMKISLILFFTIILPMMINISIFSIISTDQDKIEKNPIDEYNLSTSSGGLPNADYFSYYKTITIDHTKVNGSGSHTNFPVLISIVDSDLDDKAQWDGDDIAFANSTAWLDHEIELYDPSYSGTKAQLIAWVRIPLLSTSSDTTIFMFYGNSSMGSQENPTSVWNSNYKGVWHLKENPNDEIPGYIKDSTTNGNHGTAVYMEAGDLVTGQIDGSFRFNEFSNELDHVSVGDVGPELINTVEFWMNPDTLGRMGSTETVYMSPTTTGLDYTSWTNPTGVYTNDGNDASEPTNYDYQDWGTFGFSIPANATIDGIEASIEGSTSSFGQSVTARVRISYNGGTGFYTSYKDTSFSSTSDSYRTVGSSTDTWGRTWSPSEFNNSNFLILIQKSGSSIATLRVDHIRVKVHYSLPSDMAVIDLDGTDQIGIDYSDSEIKTLSFPGPIIYVNGVTGSTITAGAWYHVVITDTTGVSASALAIATNSSSYYQGSIDEFRLSNVIRSADWIATEYNNQYDPNSFYSVDVEQTSLTNLQVNAVDLYSNVIPNVNISMYENSNLIRSAIAGTNGSVTFENIISIENKYNFTVSMTSNILPYKTIIINVTSEAILVEGASQIINLICNVSRNNFNVVDADGIAVDSGWIEVGNSSDLIQNCTIDNAGHATFRWLNNTPYQYNYSVWYRDPNYNPQEGIIVGSGDIVTPNFDIDVIANLTTVNFTVITKDTSQPVSGVKLMLVNSDLGYNIVNFTTALDGKAIFRWVNSSGINSNYSLSIEFYGVPWDFEISGLTLGMVNKVNFSIKAKTAYDIKIDITQGELEEFETQLISLNPTENIVIEHGSRLKLRAFFNVTKVTPGYENLLGPTYADSMSYQIIEGATTVHSGLLSEDDDYVGRHQAVVETDGLEPNRIYIIKIQAQKSGYVLPPDVTMSLYLLENELILNQSQNDDSPISVYWEEDVNMSVTPYGKISEDFTLEYNIYNKINPATFKFSIPDISNDWNLSKITFNLYDISWNALSDDINITIEVSDYGIFKVFNTSNHNGHNYALNTWTGIEFNLNKNSPTGDNNFEFVIGGTFAGTIDIIADASFIRDKINIQYERFNITDAISLLEAAEGWAIKNITFELYNCYNTSSWSLIDPLSEGNLNISTNEGIKYALDSGSSGFGSLIIEDRIIYPLENQFLFTVESPPEIMFDVTIKVEYIQEFYQNHFLEIVNSSKTEHSFSNGGTFQVSVIEEGWIEDQSTILITGITDGILYYLPSELAMTITIGGIPYSISDVITGQGMVSIESLVKNNVYSAVIDTNQPTLFNLTFITDYSRLEVYETKGVVSYSIIENPTINGLVQYDEDLKCYLQTINTSLLNADDYTIRFSIIKENYVTAIKDLDLIVLNRLTLLNGSSGFFRKIENIYVEDAVNFTFLYTDALKDTRITDLVSQYYIWEKYDSDGDVVASGQETLIHTLDDLYVLDFTTENLTVGEYLLLITIGKENYEFQNAMISLTVNKRIFDYSLKYNNRTLSSNQISVEQGKTVKIEIQLTDPTKGDISLDNATFFITIGDGIYPIEALGNGNYRFYFPTVNIDTFFSSKTLTGKINISKDNYHSIEFTITIVVEMEVLFLGIPTFYFILISSLVAVFVGSIVGYRIYKKAKIPKFVKKVRSMKKIIEGGKLIPESLLYHSKETFVGERVKEKWDKIGLSLGSIFGIELEKKALKIERKISEAVNRREIRPIGLVLMKWDERVGTDILAKYPEETEIAEKTLMQIYSTHEYSAEKGTVTLASGLLNIISYYTGPESGYYLLLILKTEDDPDVYEGGMATMLRIILENIEDDSYLYMIPSLFQRLSLYPSLSDEEILALHYQDEIKRMIIDNLIQVGVITKSELTIWLKDKYVEGFIDLDATLSELLKRDIIKQVSVKGLDSELIVLTNDIFMLRVPPVKVVKDCINRGLPTQFAKDYLTEVKKFFQNYRPTAEDNLAIIEILINPQVYETLRLLRTAIVTRQDLEKLKTKGVDDPDGALKLLWDSQMIKVFRDEKGVEYYALLSDFYLDLVFPKYLLTVIKTAYEQKSQANIVLIEYLKALEDTYFDLKSQEKS
ncbi:MAG: DUF2341 domain-containing protein [Candidatus Lokiarchaeota archaeon]|nr:DUF2341 domain-containing protein [Candidatus Lokiarchaeota archaeon]